MSETTINILDNGPFMVKGPATLKDGEGVEFTIDRPQFALCRCGHSAKKPFCDGAHRGKFEDACRAGK